MQRILDLGRGGPLDIADHEVEGRTPAFGQIRLIQALTERLLDLIEHRIQRDDDDREQTHRDHQLQEGEGAAGRTAEEPALRTRAEVVCGARLNRRKVHTITGHPAGTGRNG